MDKNKRCSFENCTTRPRYGTQLTGRIHCAKHHDKSTEWRLNTCYALGCKKIAMYSYEFCDKHGMIECECGLFNGAGLCRLCSNMQD